MTDKLKKIDPAATTDLAKATASMLREMGLYRQHAVLLASLRKSAYDALIEEGFTPEQALELCKNPLA